MIGQDRGRPCLPKRAGRYVAALLLAAVTTGLLAQLVPGPMGGVLSRAVSIPPAAAQGETIDFTPLPTDQPTLPEILEEDRDDAAAIIDSTKPTAPPGANQESWASRLVKQFMYFIIDTCGRMVLWTFNLVAKVAQYNGFTTEPFVVKGWVLVRDVGNMFFILILLLIAFGTILNISSFHYRSLLWKVVLMAILVNFSKSIAGVLIDFSQVVMLTFVHAFGEALGSSFAQALGMDKLLQVQQASSPGGDLDSVETSLSTVSVGTSMLAFILGAILMVLILVVMLAILVTLVARILKLWVLIILAPLAFLASAFPKAQQYSGQWWSALTKELINGPVLAFFLWLVLAVAQDAPGGGFSSDPNSGFSGAAVGYDQAFNPSNIGIGVTANLLNFVVTIGLLIAALGIAQASGAAGAGFAGAALAKVRATGTGALRQARRLGTGTAKFAGRTTRSIGRGLYSGSGVEGKLAVTGARLKATAPVQGVTRAARFMSAEQRAARRQGRVTEAFTTAERAAMARGDERGAAAFRLGGTQAAGKQAAARNLAVAQRMKQLDEKGITSDQAIRASLAANRGADGRVNDNVLHEALMTKLAKEGTVLNAGDEIVAQTAGMQDAEAVRVRLKRAFKDQDTTAIDGATGQVLSGAALQQAVDGNMAGAATDKDKVDQVRGILAQVQLGANGQPANPLAINKLTSSGLTSQFYEKIGPAMQLQVRDAMLLAMRNTTDAGTRNQLIAKYHETVDPHEQEVAMKNKSTYTAPVFDAATGEVDVLSNAEAANRQHILRNVEQPAALDRAATQPAAVAAPLSQAEQTFQRVISEAPEVVEALEEVRAAMVELSALNLGDASPANLVALNAPMARLRTAQARATTAFESAAGPGGLNVDLRDDSGNAMTAEAFMEQRVGGNLDDRVREIRRDAIGGNLSQSQTQNHLLAAAGAVGGRINRVAPTAPRGPAGAVRAFATKYVPSFGTRRLATAATGRAPISYEEPRQKLLSLIRQRSSGYQATATRAFQQPDTERRVEMLDGLAGEVEQLLARASTIGNLSVPAQEELARLDASLAGLRTPTGEIREDVSADEVNNLIGGFTRFQNIA